MIRRQSKKTADNNIARQKPPLLSRFWKVVTASLALFGSILFVVQVVQTRPKLYAPTSGVERFDVLDSRFVIHNPSAYFSMRNVATKYVVPAVVMFPEFIEPAVIVKHLEDIPPNESVHFNCNIRDFNDRERRMRFEVVDNFIVGIDVTWNVMSIPRSKSWNATMKVSKDGAAFWIIDPVTNDLADWEITQDPPNEGAGNSSYEEYEWRTSRWPQSSSSASER